MSDPGAPAAQAGRPSSELALRIVSAVVLAVVALGAAWAGGVVFAVFWTVAALLLLREWLGIVGLVAARRTLVWIVGSVAIAAAGTLAESGPGAVPLMAAVLALGAVLALAASPVGTRGAAGAGVLYAAVVSVVPILLRNDPAHGLLAVLWMFAVVWGTDVVAFFAGRGIGGPKLWPRVSPKKTWSGFIGGVLGGGALGVLTVQAGSHAFGAMWYSGLALVGLSLGAAILSQGGDLLESSLKRKFGVKDASHLIPGHGGVMDRLDSFWAVGVLMAALMLAKAGPG